MANTTVLPPDQAVWSTETDDSSLARSVLFRCNPMPMWVHDLETLAFLEVNGAAVEHYGYSRDQFLSMKLLDICTAEAVPDFLNGTTEHVTVRHCAGPLRHLTRGGDVIEVEASATHIQYERRSACLVWLSDVTERNRAIRDAFEQRHKQEMRLTSSLDLVERFDRDCRCLYATPSVPMALGPPLSELVGKVISHTPLPADYVQAKEAAVRQAIETGEEGFVELTLTQKDHARWFEARLIPQREEPTGPVHSVLALSRDISRHKSVERALHESESRLRTLVQLCADWYWEQDAELRFVGLFGGPADASRSLDGDAIGRTLWEVPGVIFTAEQRTELETITSERRPFREFRLRRRTRDGLIRTLSLCGVPAFGARGEFLGYCGAGRDVTDEHLLRQTLARNEQRARLAVEYGHIGFWEQDLMTGYIRWSETVGDLLGMPGKTAMEVSGFAALAHPDDRAYVSEALSARRQGDGKFELEHRILRPDGTLRWIRHSGATQYDARGRLRRRLGIIQDVTSRIQGVAQGQEATCHLSLLAEALDKAFWLAEQEPVRLLYASPALERLCGVAAQELCADPAALMQRIHPADRARVATAHAIWSQHPDETTYDEQYRIVRSDDIVRWVRDRRTRVRAGDKLLLGGLVEDVTVHHDLEAALRESEERMRLALDFGQIGVWERTAAPSIIRWSAQVPVIFGLPADVDSISLDEFALLVHPDDRQLLNDARSEWRCGRSRAVEHRIARPDSTVRWVQQRGSTQYDAAGIPRRTLGVVQDITERKLAEAALRESEERFRVLTALSSDYYWEQDEELRFKVITRANLEDTPAPESTAIGKRRWEVESLRAPAAAWRAHRRTLLERKPFRDFIVERYLLDGSIRQHAVSGVPVFALDGTFQGYRGVARDVTERERSRTQFRELRDRFERLANSINEVFYFIDQEPRRIHYINPAFENIYGLSLEALYADPDLWLKTIHVEDRRDVEQQFQGWLSQRGSSPFEAEYRIVRPDGEVRWMHDRAVRVGASPGGALQISGIAEDITSRKHAELVLRESEEKFRLLAENLREVVWISDPGLKHLLYVGPSFAEVWGAPLEAATADPVRWQLRVHPEDLPRVRQALRNQEQGQPAEVEFRITRPDGQLRWLSVRSSPMTDSHGQRLVCGVTEDVTHRVLEHARRLEQAIRQRDTLVREVHHRIKNSLQGVAGLLRSHAQRDRRAAPLFEVAIGQIQSIATVHGLQSMGSGGGAGIDDVVEAVARMVEGLTHKRIDLERSGVTDRRFVLAEGEAVAVALILNEIIVNAVKHCMSCGRGAEITASIVSRGDTMEVAVRNAGTLPKGFDLGSRAGLGTGLGLVCALLPTKGVALNISSEAGQVESVLTFREPVIQRTTAQ